MNINRDMPQVDALRKRIEQVMGGMPSHSSFEKLQSLIENRCNEHVSITTLERVWGYSTRGGNNISVRILDILSRSTGAGNWEDFCKSFSRSEGKESLVFKSNGAIESNRLAVGTRIRIGWQPDRVCEAEYLGDNRYITIWSENASIKAGDSFRCLIIQKGRELYMDNFTRKGETESNDRYVVGQINGLTLVETIED